MMKEEMQTTVDDERLMSLVIRHPSFVAEDRVVLVTGFVDAALAMLGGGGTAATGEVEDVAPTEVICYQVAPGQAPAAPPRR